MDTLLAVLQQSGDEHKLAKQMQASKLSECWDFPQSLAGDWQLIIDGMCLN